MISRDFFSVANNLGDSVAFNLESDSDSSFCTLERFMKEETKGCFADSAFFSNECDLHTYMLYNVETL